MTEANKKNQMAMFPMKVDAFLEQYTKLMIPEEIKELESGQF